MVPLLRLSRPARPLPRSLSSLQSLAVRVWDLSPVLPGIPQLIVLRLPRLLGYFAPWLFKCVPAYKANLLFRVHRCHRFGVFEFLRAIAVPCVLFRLSDTP